MESHESQLLAFGPNQHGQLGDGSPADASVPRPVAGLAGIRVISVAAGGGHSAATSAGGALFTWGWNAAGQLGHGAARIGENVPTPRRVATAHAIAAVALGWAHTLALTEGGAVLGCGCNRYGQTAPARHGAEVQVAELDAHVAGLAPGAAVACGARHSLVVGRDGTVVGWGCGRHGQLGGSPASADPKQALALPCAEPVAAAAAGFKHSALLSRAGRVFVYGSDEKGQRGGAAAGDAVALPAAAGGAGAAVVTQISSGWSHVAAVEGASGRVFAWGRCDLGQTGTGASAAQQVPLEFEASAGASWVCCGSEHNVAAAAGGSSLASWGWNEHGNLGVGDELDRDRPQAVPLGGERRAVAAAAACGHTVLLLRPSD